MKVIQGYGSKYIWWVLKFGFAAFYVIPFTTQAINHPPNPSRFKACPSSCLFNFSSIIFFHILDDIILPRSAVLQAEVRTCFSTCSSVCISALWICGQSYPSSDRPVRFKYLFPGSNNLKFEERFCCASLILGQAQPCPLPSVTSRGLFCKRTAILE